MYATIDRQRINTRENRHTHHITQITQLLDDNHSQ
nr:MAG TPA: hypothetical protein [Caudoviricetes sp.]